MRDASETWRQTGSNPSSPVSAEWSSPPYAISYRGNFFRASAMSQALACRTDQQPCEDCDIECLFDLRPVRSSSSLLLFDTDLT
jgi:hypothetical protein